jgi:hypothetical protein
MARYVLTGAPGSGKTAILRLLELAGYRVVEEAATDVIALRRALGQPEAWTGPDFVDAIVSLQRRRQDRAERDCAGVDGIFFDRWPVCTLALSRYLGFPVSPLLAAEVDRVVADRAATLAFFVRGVRRADGGPADQLRGLAGVRGRARADLSRARVRADRRAGWPAAGARGPGVRGGWRRSGAGRHQGARMG